MSLIFHNVKVTQYVCLLPSLAQGQGPPLRARARATLSGDNGGGRQLQSFLGEIIDLFCSVVAALVGVIASTSFTRAYTLIGAGAWVAPKHPHLQREPEGRRYALVCARTPACSNPKFSPSLGYCRPGFGRILARSTALSSLLS